MKSPPRVNEFKLRQRNIGPGTYSTRCTPSSPSCRFASEPRFKTIDKLQMLLKHVEKKSPDRLLKGKLIFRQNLDVSPHQPEEKSEKIRQIAEIRSCSQLVVRRTKEILEVNRRNVKLERIERRDEKLKKWSANKKFLAAVKGWSVLMVIISLNRKAIVMMEKRKLIKSIFVFNSSLLYQVSKSVGKIRKSVKSIRKAKAMKKIKTIFMPMFRRKLNSLLNQYKRRIIHVIESGLTQRLIKKICTFWRRKMNKFETGLRGLVLVYISRVSSLHQLWDEIQKKFNYYSSKYIFPKEVSIKIIRRYLLKKLKEFYFYQRDLKQNIQKFKNEYQRKPAFRTFELTQRRTGIRFSIALRSFPSLRIFNKEELIPLYLEEEAKLHVLPPIKESRQSHTSEASKDSSSNHLHNKKKNK